MALATLWYGENASLPILPNRLVLDRPLPQVLEAQQHRKHPFELAVQMDLIAAQLLQLARIE